MTLKYRLYFLLPVTAAFAVSFIGANFAPLIAFAKGRAPFLQWHCAFNLLVGKVALNGARQPGDTALLLGWQEYVGDRDVPYELFAHQLTVRREASCC